MSEEEKILRERLEKLSGLYHSHWRKACEFEGASETALAVEFTEGNIDAVACAEIMKEMTQIKHALNSNIIGRINEEK